MVHSASIIYVAGITASSQILWYELLGSEEGNARTAAGVV
jgi:hypothetical protein